MVENILCDFSLQLSCRTTEFVEVAIEPLIDLSVQCMVVIANLLACLACLTGFRLRSSSILICTTDVDSVMASKAAISRIDIC